MPPITADELQTVTVQIWAMGFAMSLATGMLIHRSHFCTMGAISDWVLMRNATRLRQWALALAVAILGFGAMSWMGWIDPANTIYASKHLSWLSGLLGGAFFGVGMVLASGCSSKSLVRLGAGNLKSLVVLLAMAVAALATMKGLTAVWRVNLMDPIGVNLPHGPFVGQWLAALTGLALSDALGLSAVLVALLLLLWVVQERGFHTVFNWVTGAGLGLLVVAFWWLTGVFGFVQEHPLTLEPVFLTTHSGRMEALSFTAPVGYWLDALLYYSDGSKRLTLGMVTVAGVLAGACISARLEGSFRWESFAHRKDLVLHLIGGSFMGFGGVLAMGCTFGQGLTGLSTLSLGSFLSVIGLFLGAYAALQWQMRQHG